MDDLYPPGPKAPPASLTQPTAQYKRHAYLAFFALTAFLACYFGLATWFAWTAYRLFSALGRSGGLLFALLLGGSGAGFLALMMWKGVFFIKRGTSGNALELKPAEHPRLFAFLHRLADDARAPRPHRVFLSTTVNAAVFYDLSILNFIWPSKKNLEIGLGLVNLLSLSELKAVLAHEFGHFAQRSMAVGRYVYVAQQVAGHFIAVRGRLDRFLAGLSALDLRIAWIGWLLRILVWAVRSVAETVFGWVLIAERALSREMEFQADLIAVSLAGSDAGIHALHRLRAADEAMDMALSFLGTQAGKGKAQPDLMALQSRIIEHLRRVYGDPQVGDPPRLPGDPQAATQHRLFKAALAQPPKMWSTHPPNNEREDNAKRTYVTAPLDERSAWLLFDEPDALRKKATASLYATITEKLELVTLEESLKELDREFDKPQMMPAYRGAYLGRSPVRNVKTVDELYGNPPDDLVRELEALYPESLRELLEKVQELAVEKAQLRSLHAGILTAPGGIVRYRGVERKRKELPTLIATVEEDLKRSEAEISEHDRRCRTVHLELARKLGNGWEEYLRGLAATLHFADHVEAELRDAWHALQNVIAVATADGRVSADERAQVLIAASDLYHSLDRIHREPKAVALDERLLKRLEAESFASTFQEFKLPPPDESILGDWLGAIDGWVVDVGSSLTSLRRAALSELLATESELSGFLKRGEVPPPAPAPSRVPAKYSTMLPGEERPLKKLNWWDRFQLADGLGPAAARLLVSGSILGSVLYAGYAIGSSEVIIYNGLEKPVIVEILGQEIHVPRHANSMRIDVGSASSLSVVTKTAAGAPIETFSIPVDTNFQTYVYNVAQAGVLAMQYTGYGTPAPAMKFLGNQRWVQASTDYVFTEPPSSGSRGTVLGMLASAPTNNPELLVDLLRQPEERRLLAAAHAQFDGTPSEINPIWLNILVNEDVATLRPLVARWLSENPNDLMALRIEQDSTSGEEHARVCDRHKKTAQQNPTSADWAYLSTRCLEDEAKKYSQYLSLVERYPNHGWLAYAAGFVLAENADWKRATARFDVAMLNLPQAIAMAGVDIARIKRAAADNLAVPSRLVVQGGRLEYLLDSEQAQGESMTAGYRTLATGKLTQAVEEAPRDARLLLLAAASDGAPPELSARWQALRPDIEPAYVLYSLKRRAGLDVKEDEARLLKRFGKSAPAAARFLSALRKDLNPAAVEASIGPLAPVLRGWLYAIAALVLGESCPPSWRRAAVLLLFAYERPYFKT